MTRRPADDAAVSNVLGAVLMFGLLVLTLTVIQVKFVPVWSEDREARHMQALADDLRQLKSDLDRQAGNDTATPITANLPLSTGGGFRFFQPPANLGSTAAFSPSPSGIGLVASSTKPVQVLRRDGLDLFATGNSWDPQLEGSSDIYDVTNVQHLRERIDLCQGVTSGGSCPDSYIGGPNANDYDANDLVTLYIFSSTDDVNPLCRIVTTTSLNSGEYTFTVHLYDASGNEVSSDFESLFQQVTQDYLYFDLLDSSLFLEPVLATGQAPFHFRLVESGLNADYQVVYTDAATGALGGSAGILQAAGFSQTTASGRLELQSNNQHYEDQTYVLEHGAVILEQPQGSAMVAPPAIGAAMGAEQGAFTWTVAGLAGGGLERGGDRVEAVATPTGDADEIWVLAPQATITIPTTRGEAWATYLGDLLFDAGWSAGTYTITTNAASVQVLLEGPVANDVSCTNANQANCVYDVSLRLRVSTINLALAPG